MTDYENKGLPAGAVAYMRRLEKAHSRLDVLDSWSVKLAQMDYELHGLNILFKPASDAQTLIVIKAFGPDGGPVVAFVGSDSLLLALDKAFRESIAGELGWKHDEFRANK